MDGESLRRSHAQCLEQRSIVWMQDIQTRLTKSGTLVVDPVLASLQQKRFACCHRSTADLLGDKYIGYVLDILRPGWWRCFARQLLTEESNMQREDSVQDAAKKLM